MSADANDEVSVDELLGLTAPGPSASPEAPADPVVGTPAAEESGVSHVPTATEAPQMGPEGGEGQAPPQSPPVAAQEPETPVEEFLVHFLDDGLTLAGKVWYRGQTLLVDSKVRSRTTDRLGRCVLDLTAEQQTAKWGRPKFGRGPWPGEQWTDPKAAEAEARRAGKLPTDAASGEITQADLPKDV